jgi:hypothetical protein
MTGSSTTCRSSSTRPTRLKLDSERFLVDYPHVELKENAHHLSTQRKQVVRAHFEQHFEHAAQASGSGCRAHTAEDNVEHTCLRCVLEVCA